MKSLFRIIIGFVCATFILGCITYEPYNSKTPVSERCLIELTAGISVSNLNNERGWVDLHKTIPAGLHTIVFKIGREVFTSGNAMSVYSGRSYSLTTYTANISKTYNFEPGHHYVAEVMFFTEDGQTTSAEAHTVGKLNDGTGDLYVNINIIDKGTKTSVFNNGVYSTWGGYGSVYAGSNSISYISLGMDFGARYAIHGSSYLNLNLGLGADMSIYPLLTGSSAKAIFLADYNIPKTNLTLGAGGGYNYPFGFSAFPYARAEIGNINGLKFYFEYYFNRDLKDDVSSDKSWDDDMRPSVRSWGVGINIRP